jgi:hypothetical protein
MECSLCGYRTDDRSALGEHLADQHPAEAWNTVELQRDFEVIAFLAPHVVVRRRCDGQKGVLEFTHAPRCYFNFQAVD